MYGTNRNDAGTRFKLFARPPYVHADWRPDEISIDASRGLIGAGPSDDRLYVIEPIGKTKQYGLSSGPRGTPHLYFPPWRGPIYAPAQPAADGHFDSIALDAPEFARAHVFGAIRFGIAVWERYLGRRIDWFFARDFDRLEVVILPQLNNATAGYGYMEVGAYHAKDGVLLPFSLNFDVIAHELGHLIIFSTVGVPDTRTERGEYFGFHEAAADTTALIAAIHFESLIEHLLDETHGNLFSFNELDRFAELTTNTQIRLASNSVKLSDFAAGWTDEHALSQPLAGALFDILVDIFQENLVARGLITREATDLADRVRKLPEYGPVIQAIYDAAYSGHYEEFRASLVDARDYMGFALAETWKRLSADYFDYRQVALTLLAVDRALSGGRYQDEITESFAWREIGTVKVGPRLSPPNASSHVFSARTVGPEIRHSLPKMHYYERHLLARGVS